MPQNFFGNNIWQEMLETDPLGRQTIFQSFIPQGYGAAQREQASNLFQPAFNQYLGQFGQQLGQVSRGEREEEPTSFTDFIRDCQKHDVMIGRAAIMKKFYRNTSRYF